MGAVSAATCSSTGSAAAGAAAPLLCSITWGVEKRTCYIHTILVGRFMHTGNLPVLTPLQSAQALPNYNET